MKSSPHYFHIPVMGLAYTVDTPIKVARYGINSVVSIIEDNLIELMRKHYCTQFGKEFKPITSKEEDYRAGRITGYLNLVNEIVKEQVEKIRNSVFEPGSEIVKYYEMLPERSMLKQSYNRMMGSDNDREKKVLTGYLRSHVTAGCIDVNIMTKVDKNNYDRHGNLIADGSDAVAALRGYVNSDLTNSSVVLSAGLNPRLFNYLEKTTGFDAKVSGTFDKKITIKVSDYRSAFIQGKYLAKKGLWVSEFRIESGLNCGGHAFATDGTLLGPIMQEFKNRKQELTDTLFTLYKSALESKGAYVFTEPHPIKITVQGGIGTHEEDEFLHTHYGVESTGWGTPFLLCPEATTVDDATLKLLSKATERDVILSKNSPLGVRFNYLKGTSSDKEKRGRIAKGRPGSPCTEKYLVSNTEFSKAPICTASHKYQKRKIEQLQTQNLDPADYEKRYTETVNKECLCIGLSNAAVLRYGLPPIKRLKAVTICPGPNIAYFNRIVTLRDMVDHIYGRNNILSRTDRPNMFIKELQLNIDYLKEQLQDLNGTNDKMRKDVTGFANHLLEGISYYRQLSGEISKDDADTFAQELDRSEVEIRSSLSHIF